MTSYKGNLDIDMEDNDINNVNTIDLSAIKINGSAGANGQTIFTNGTTVEWGTGSGTGDMLTSIYDPGDVNDDAFDMDNMVEGTDTKILTATERTNIANNTTNSHTAVAVIDSSEIDFTLTGQTITGSLITGSIDVLKLDTGVQSSLGLADSSIQPNDNISTLTNDSGFITATLTNEQVQDIVGAMTTSNTETLITVTYQDADGTIDFVVDNDLANYSNTNSGFITDITGENLSALKDVTITTIANGELLRWDGNKWINNTLAEADVASATTLGSHTGDSTIHFTQGNISIPASQISDFDTEVSNNSDVSANTSARHAAVTVLDSSEIDFTLTGQQITASIKSGSIDETKLDVSTNSSLDLADSALQDLSDDSSPTLGGDLTAADYDITGLGSVSFTQELDNGSKTGNFSVDFSTDQKQKATLTANTITLTLDTTSVGVGNYVLKLVNGGLATLTWASESGSVYWPGGTGPTLTSSGTDIVSFYFDGTNWYGVASLDFQ